MKRKSFEGMRCPVARSPERVDEPSRMEYVLTDVGRDVDSVLMALAAFGQRHLANDPEPGLAVVSRRTGEPAEIQVVDERHGKPMRWNDDNFAEPASRRAKHATAKR